MHRLYVELPEGDPVDTFLFSRNISRALIALAADPRAALLEGLFESKVTAIKVGDADMETIGALTTGDRKLLRAILEDLPSLTIASDASTRTQFQERWKQHPKAPAWQPKLPTERDQAAAAFQATFVQGRHLDQLQEWVDRGALRVFDRHRLSVWKVGLDAYISRADAERYLEEHGMDVTKSAPAIHGELLWSADAMKQIASVMKGNESEAARARGPRRHSSEWATSTVDGLLNFLIDSKLGDLGALKQPPSKIVEQVVLAFMLAADTMRPQDLIDIENKGAHFEILRLRGVRITRETIRGRIRTRRQKLLAAARSGQ